MFWKYQLTVSQIDTLLDKQGVTLTEVLEQEDVIQECKSQNKKLVEFLTKPEVLSELLDLILEEPSEELEERLRFKLPNIASEVITCDVPQINEKLSSDPALLDKMYAFLERPPPLNPLLTSFFSKAFGVLISRRPEQNWYSYQYTCLQVIEYIKAKEGFTGLLLTHIATSAVMDLLLRLITCVEGAENKQNILTWLNEERLIQRVLGLLAPPEPAEPGEPGPGGGEPAQSSHTVPNRAEVHDNAGQLLVEIIRSSRDALLTASPAERFLNPLLATAESADMVQLLLGYMLDGPAVESTIVNGVEVLLALLEVRRPLPHTTGFYGGAEESPACGADLERQEGVRDRAVECLLPRLPQLTSLLICPPHKPSITTTAGLLQVPLGRSRLAVTKLLAALLATSHPPLNTALVAANTTTVLIDLFFEYSLNNFLHAHVESCVHSIIFWKREKTEPGSPAVTGEEGGGSSDSLQTPKVTEAGPDEGTEHPLQDSIENPALVHLLTTARLLDRVIASWTVETRAPNVAYMGHVTKISNHLVAACAAEDDTAGPACASRTLLLQVLSNLPQETQASWAAIVAGILTDTNTLNQVKPAMEEKRTLSSDDDDEFRDIQFPPNSLQQEMSDNFIDSFGFNDEEFTESEDSGSRGMRKLNSVNFLMATDDSTKQAIFQSVCEQRVKAFRSSPEPGEGEAGEDPWADKTAEISFSNKEPVVGSGAGDSSDEEENEPAPVKMEVDQEADPWDTAAAPESSVAMETSSPWQTEPTPSTAGETGWADFTAFPSGEGTGEGAEDGWSPGMSSSPEATMLDCAPVESVEGVEQSEQEGGPRLSPPDISDSNANPAPVPSDRLAGEEQEGEQAAAQPGQENFAFLAARGLITASEEEDQAEAGNSGKEEASSPVKQSAPVEAVAEVVTGSGGDT